MRETFPDPTGYDERLFRLMLAEFVRRNFPEPERKRLPDVRVSICTPYDANDPETDYHEAQSIIVLPSKPSPRPLGNRREVGHGE